MTNRGGRAGLGRSALADARLAGLSARAEVAVVTRRSLLRSAAACASAIAHPVQPAGRARRRARAVGYLSRGDWQALPCGPPRQVTRARIAACANSVAANAIGHDPGRALVGLRCGRSFRLLRLAGPSCGIAVARAGASTLIEAGRRTPVRGTREPFAILGGSGPAGPETVAGCGRRETAAVARGLSAGLAAAHLPAGPGPVTQAIVATRFARGLIRAGVVRIPANHDKSTGTIGLAGECLRASVAARACLVAADTVHADPRGTGAVCRARRTDGRSLGGVGERAIKRRIDDRPTGAPGTRAAGATGAASAASGTAPSTAAA
jgi:hypothetical protein